MSATTADVKKSGSGADTGPRPVLVGALGSAILAGTAWFAWSLPAVDGRRVRPGAGLVNRSGAWGWLFDHAAPPSTPGRLGAALVLATVVMFTAWLGIVVFTWGRSGPAMVRLVVGLVVAATAISGFALPNQTSDIYDYALFGRVVAVHGGEAYHDLPVQYPDDPVFAYSTHQYTDRPDNKLPAWTATAIGVSKVAGRSPLANLLAFRLLLGLATVATTVLVAAVLGRLHPKSAATGAAIFGLNPITVVYGTSKTDALMVFLLVSGVALVVLRRRYLATALVTLSVLVKLITAPVLVLLMAMPLPARSDSPDQPDSTVRGYLRSGLRRGLLAAGVIALVNAPFRDPLGLVRSQLIGANDASVLRGAHPIAVGVFAVGLVAISFVVWRRGPQPYTAQIETFLSCSAASLVVFAVFLTRPGLPWYLLSALAMVALARSAALLVLLTVISAASFLMGWWDAIGTPDHPLPPLAFDRPIAYLATALAAAALAAGVAVARRRGSLSGLRLWLPLTPDRHEIEP